MKQTISYLWYHSIFNICLCTRYFPTRGNLRIFFHAMASAKNTKKSDVDVKQEDIIIAVLIADSFSTRFAPITVDKPKVYIYCFSYF